MTNSKFPTDLGKSMVNYSRKTIDSFVKNQITLDPLYTEELLKEKAGVFCTLRKFGQLRGCIGFPYPNLPLGQALVQSSISSATEDPRFPKVNEEELKDITIELTILTPPQLITVKKFEDYLENIVIGVDGLIIENKNKRGLLLPQVPVEQKWSILQFLEGICQKAYLPKNSWKDINEVKLYKFQGIIFNE